jgi:hypothetical protein
LGSSSLIASRRVAVCLLCHFGLNSFERKVAMLGLAYSGYAGALVKCLSSP